uniref:Uncharacterized protein n=1 Tax=Tanacetum cinerariifolium TaxID=118510 RepID=A0A699GZ45_TANCI|nr:hypothetical protein [Tanacetum cinerariifolium]
MARRPLGWKVVEHVSHKRFSNGGVIVVEDDPDVIYVDNSPDLALSISLNDMEITALHIDGQFVSSAAKLTVHCSGCIYTSTVASSTVILSSKCLQFEHSAFLELPGEEIGSMKILKNKLESVKILENKLESLNL